MRKTMRILGVSVRGQGAVATYGGRSPEFVQKTVAASRRRCRSYGSCEGKRRVSEGAQRLTEQDKVNARLRGTLCSPEFAGAVVGDGGVAESNALSLVALWVRVLGEKKEGTEGVLIAWSRARIALPITRIDAAD